MNAKREIAIVFLGSLTINIFIIRYINNPIHLRAQLARNLTSFEKFKAKLGFTLTYDVKPAIIIAMIITLIFSVILYFRSRRSTN